MPASRKAKAPRSVLITAVVAAVMTVAALATVAALRWRADNFATSDEPTTPPTSVGLAAGCGGGPCQVLSSAPVHGTPIELLTDNNGGSGRVRVGGVGSDIVIPITINQFGVRLNQNSLRCVAGETSVCLVRGPNDGGMVGEVLVSRGDSWRPAERPYFSDAGHIVLDDVDGDDVPEIVVVRHDCSSESGSSRCATAPVLAQVYGVAGEVLGCTKRYTSPSNIRGWPEVNISVSQLRGCDRS